MAQLAPAEVDVVIERALSELPFHDWTIIDTRREPKTPRADFVVVGPPGLFVIGCGRRHEKDRARAKELMRLLDTAHDPRQDKRCGRRSRSTPEGRRRQEVRQRSAKPPSPVQIRAAPPIFLGLFRTHG